MRASRLLSILILLQLRVRLTAEALADEFKVSVRTIYRDIDCLSAAGIPVFGDAGPGGGFQLVDGYQTRLTGLDADEAEAVLLAGMPETAAALGLGAAAGRAKAKLLVALKAQGKIGSERIAARFHLDPVDWYQAAEHVKNLPTLTRAVLDEQCLRLIYESWRGERMRRVEPMGLVQKGGGWYLVARTDGQYRTYKVASIKSLTVLNATFQRPENFDLAAHWANQLRRFETQLRKQTVKIWVTALGCERLATLGAYASEAVALRRPIGSDGWNAVVLPIENLEQAAVTLLGMGPEIRVVQPAALRLRMQKLARAMVLLLRA
jgi:predicted DNA-binding transcriptional regulator YafY